MSKLPKDVTITDHTYARAKERLGLNKKAFNRLAAIAFEKGKQHKDLTGNLYKWTTSRILSTMHHPQVRVYSNFMLIIQDTTVRTVITLPQNLIKSTQNRSKSNPKIVKNPMLAPFVKKSEYKDYLNTKVITNCIPVEIAYTDQCDLKKPK